MSLGGKQKFNAVIYARKDEKYIYQPKEPFKAFLFRITKDATLSRGKMNR